MLFKHWRNPYLIITVSSARYSQKGVLRENYWLDLANAYIENNQGQAPLEAIKKFTVTEPLPVSVFNIDKVLEEYENIVLDTDSNNDITNYLFVSVEGVDKVYKYVKDYTVDTNGVVTNQTWEEYTFRIVKQFSAENWTEQEYLLDLKIVAGTTLQEFVTEVLTQEKNFTEEIITDRVWTEEELLAYIEMIVDKGAREFAYATVADETPLIKPYDTRLVLNEGIKVYVSSNLQEGK